MRSLSNHTERREQQLLDPSDCQATVLKKEKGRQLIGGGIKSLRKTEKLFAVLDFYVNRFVHRNPRPGYLFKRVTILKEWLMHSR